MSQPLRGAAGTGRGSCRPMLPGFGEADETASLMQGGLVVAETMKMAGGSAQMLSKM